MNDITAPYYAELPVGQGGQQADRLDAQGHLLGAARAARDGHPRLGEEDRHVLVRVPVLQEQGARRAQLHLRGRPAIRGPATEVDPTRGEPPRLHELRGRPWL